MNIMHEAINILDDIHCHMIHQSVV